MKPLKGKETLFVILFNSIIAVVIAAVSCYSEKGLSDNTLGIIVTTIAAVIVAFILSVIAEEEYGAMFGPAVMSFCQLLITSGIFMIPEIKVGDSLIKAAMSPPFGLEYLVPFATLIALIELGGNVWIKKNC